MAEDRVTHALRYLAENFVVSRQEFQQAQGAMMLEGLVSKGYAREAKDDGRLVVTEAGRARLAHKDPITEEADA